MPKPAKPNTLPAKAAPGYIRLNPTRVYVSRPIATMETFLNRMLTVFLARVNPLSSVANPRCMANTRNVQTIIHTLLTVNISGLTDPVSAVGAAAPMDAEAAPAPPAWSPTTTLDRQHAKATPSKMTKTLRLIAILLLTDLYKTRVVMRWDNARAVPTLPRMAATIVARH